MRFPETTVWWWKALHHCPPTSGKYQWVKPFPPPHPPAWNFNPIYAFKKQNDISLNVKNKENPLVQHISAITCRNDHHWSDTVLKLEGISHLMFVGPAYLGVVNPQKHEPIKTQNFNTKQSLLVSQISQVPHSRKIPSLNLAYLATGLCN